MFRKPEQNIGFYYTNTIRTHYISNNYDRAKGIIEGLGLTTEQLNVIIDETHIIKFNENKTATGGSYVCIPDPGEHPYLYHYKHPKTLPEFTMDGYLAPNGDFYSCGHQGHIALSELLEKYRIIPKHPKKHISETMNKLGWTRVQNGNNLIFDTKLTQKQIDRIFDEIKDEKITVNHQEYNTFAEYLNTLDS